MFIRWHPAAFEPESGAWGLQGYTRVHIEAVDEDVLGEAMTLAWRAAASKPAARRSRRRRPGKRNRGKRTVADGCGRPS